MQNKGYIVNELKDQKPVSMVNGGTRILDGSTFIIGKSKEDGLNEKIIAVLGSGDYGRAISGRMVKCGYTVYIGSRNPDNKVTQNLVKPTGAILVDQEIATASAETILVAVGRDHYENLPLGLLRGKIVIDVSNNTKLQKGRHRLSNAEYLQSLIPDAKVVKSFNVLSAYTLENGGLQGSKEVYIASDDNDAKLIVSNLIRSMNFTPVDWGALTAARDIEAIPLQLMPSWHRPIAVVFGLFVFLWLLTFFKAQICKNIETNNWTNSWRHITMKNYNRTIGILALWVLSFCYLPGLLAAYIQLWRGTKYSRFPNWLDNWLKMRKQLGLLMLGIASVHGCISVGYVSPQLDKSVYLPPKVYNVSTIVGNTTVFQLIKEYNFEFSVSGGLFLIFGALALCLAVILGITSLPSVTGILSWREFTFVQSKLGWVLLVIATLHDLLLGYSFMFTYYSCFQSLPTGPQIALYAPAICFILKIPLLLPFVDRQLMSIRKGNDRKRRSKITPA